MPIASFRFELPMLDCMYVVRKTGDGVDTVEDLMLTSQLMLEHAQLLHRFQRAGWTVGQENDDSSPFAVVTKQFADDVTVQQIQAQVVDLAGNEDLLGRLIIV